MRVGVFSSFPFFIMSTTDPRLFNGSYQDVLDRAFAFQALGAVPARQAVLAAADALLTPKWFTDLLTQANAAQALPGLDLRDAGQHSTVLSRDQALDQARPLLQDLFFYAKKAYPGISNASDLFGHHAVTAAGSNAADLNTALQAAAVQVSARKAVLLTPGGMPQAKITRLLELAGLAQGAAVKVLTEAGEGTVATDQYVDEFNALWKKLVLLHEAAEVAYRADDTSRRLFRLYPDGPEERELTANATPATPGSGLAVPTPTRRVTRLDSELSADRVLSFAVDAPAGPVRVALLLAPDDQPAHGQLLGTTSPRRPVRWRAADLGPAGAQYLLLENPGPEKASLHVRVLPVGEEE